MASDSLTTGTKKMSGIQVITKTLEEGLNSFIQNWTNSMQLVFNYRDQLNWLYAWACHVMEQEKPLYHNYEGDKEIPVYRKPYVSTWIGKPMLSLNVEVDSFKEGKLPQILSELEEFNNAGCKCKEKAKVSCNETAQSTFGNRKYEYEWEFGTVIINADLASDSEKCKTVLVGYDTVTVPHYKFEC